MLIYIYLQTLIQETVENEVYGYSRPQDLVYSKEVIQKISAIIPCKQEATEHDYI